MVKDLLHSFQACKAQMDFRGRQAWAFWSDFLYVMLSIGHFMLDPAVSEDVCRERAAQLVQMIDHHPEVLWGL